MSLPAFLVVSCLALDVPAATAPSGDGTEFGGKVIVGYAVAGRAEPFDDPAARDFVFGRLTHLVLLGATSFDKDGNVRLNESLMEKAVRVTHGKGRKICATFIGPHAEVFGNPESRSRLVASVISICRRFKLDGADFDFEYPRNMKENRNFEVFLNELRAAAPKGMLISAAVSTWGVEPHYVPVAALNSLDWIFLMAYCGNPNRMTFETAAKDLRNCVSLGVPESKIVFGLPLYGSNGTPGPGYAGLLGADKLEPAIDVHKGWHFNGPTTIRRKTRHAVDKGLMGIGWWYVGLDARDERSIMQAAVEALRKTSSETTSTAAPETADHTNEALQAFKNRMAAWEEARFGMFIHFGLYSTPGGVWKGKPVEGYAEWIQANADIPPKDYETLLSQFNPTGFDAEAIVLAAKNAGMRYLIVTTKHHDGFCLWPTKQQSGWNVASTPFKRDIVGELAAACRKHGIRFGTYYSITDWHHPSQFIERDAHGRAPLDNYFQTRMHEGRKDEYIIYMKSQIDELVRNYDTDILWFDGDWVDWWTLEDGKELYNYIRNLKPSIIINNRVAKRHQFKLDFGTPENETPGVKLDHLWEACWTMNGSWGFKQHDNSWKTTAQLIHKLVDIASKGGNLLLNVGPDGHGAIPPESLKRLAEMGASLKVNGAAIHGSGASPFRTGGTSPGNGEMDEGCNQDGLPSADWRATTKPGEILLTLLNWPKDGRLKLPRIQAKIKRVSLLANDRELEFAATGSGPGISLPVEAPDSPATVIRIETEVPADN